MCTTRFLSSVSQLPTVTPVTVLACSSDLPPSVMPGDRACSTACYLQILARTQQSSARVHAMHAQFAVQAWDWQAEASHMLHPDAFSRCARTPHSLLAVAPAGSLDSSSGQAPSGAFSYIIHSTERQRKRRRTCGGPHICLQAATWCASSLPSRIQSVYRQQGAGSLHRLPKRVVGRELLVSHPAC